MKIPLPLLVVLLFVTATTHAQKFELKINAGANLTLLPGFNNKIYTAENFVVPGFININNAQQVSINECTSKTKPGFGFNVEAEAGKKLNDKWKLSFALGLMQMRYDYDTYIPQSFYKNDFYLSDLSDKYGDTRLTYLTARPVNVSRTFNRFSVQGGAVISYLINKKYTNAVILYNGTGDAAGGFFEEKGDAQKFLFGAHLNARYSVAHNLEVMLGGQYFFNSLYKSEGTFKPLHDKSKALQLQLGLSYDLGAIFRGV